MTKLGEQVLEICFVIQFRSCYHPSASPEC